MSLFEPDLEVRCSPDVLFRELVDESVLLDLRSQRYYGLDEVGTRMWQLLAETGRFEAAVRGLLEEFEVEEGELLSDSRALVQGLAEAGLVELSRPLPGGG